MSFIAESQGCFISLRVLWKSSKTYYFGTVFRQLFSTMVSVSYIYVWQIARLHCFCLSHALGMFNLVQICQNPVFSKNLKASLMSSTRALFSHKARCFSQSEHASYYKIQYNAAQCNAIQCNINLGRAVAVIAELCDAGGFSRWKYFSKSKTPVRREKPAAFKMAILRQSKRRNVNTSTGRSTFRPSHQVKRTTPTAWFMILKLYHVITMKFRRLSNFRKWFEYLSSSNSALQTKMEAMEKVTSMKQNLEKAWWRMY